MDSNLAGVSFALSLSCNFLCGGTFLNITEGCPSISTVRVISREIYKWPCLDKLIVLAS